MSTAHSDDSQFLPSTKLVDGVRCPVCATAVEYDAVVCPRCQTPHHRECWQYTGGCAIFGCDELRWRAMPQRRDEAQTVQLQETTRQWLELFRYHWVTFVILSAGVISSLTLHAATSLFFTVFPPTTISLQSAAQLAGTAELFCYAVLFVGLASYFALVLPALIRQRSLEKNMGSALPRPAGMPEALAERLQLPSFGTVVARAYRVTAAVLTGLAGVVAATIIVSAARGAVVGIGSLAVLLFLRILLLPWFSVATTSRMELLVSVQNRVLASFKEGGSGKA